MRRRWLAWLLICVAIAATVVLVGRAAPWKHPRPIQYQDMQKG